MPCLRGSHPRQYTIGGTASNAGNVIAGNGSTGILINAANSNVVQFNDIGVEADGMTPLPNAEGVTIIGGASNNLIGGVGDGNQEGGIVAVQVGL